MIPTSAIIDIAKRESEKADYRFRVGAVVYEGKYPLGRGFNKPNKTHPKSRTPYNTIHAEFAAILDTSSRMGWNELDGLSIYVHRILRNGEPGLAKPCKYCDAMLKWAGIKEVYYSES